LVKSGRESDYDPLALARKLLLSYLAVFGITFFAAALSVRFAFVTSLEGQTTARLELLARAGLRSILYSGAKMAIDKREISNTALLSRDQGLQWYDARRRQLASEGLTPDIPLSHPDGRARAKLGLQTFEMFAIPIVDPSTHARVGTVRSSEWNEREMSEIRWLDTGLAIGTLLALLGSGLSGLVLTRRAARPVAQSFERLREFTADASHELRSPLTAIASNADAALRDAREPARDRARFEAIADGARQISRLAADLLLLAGSDRSLERELFVVELYAIFARLEARYGASFAQAGIAFRLPADRDTIVYGNPDQIERIFTNLLDNARRYTPPGGSVVVESYAERGSVQIAVRDSGIGIAEEHLERVFDRFWRADAARSHDGTGLGLAIARALARRHGGDVNVSSALGAGTEFIVTLPTRPPRNA
jgi:signal transduction histidine kinase